jgi:hypothetical protein
MILIEVINNYGTTLAYNHDNVLIAKSCGKCSEVLSLSQFHKTKVCKTTGTVSSCRLCLKAFHNKNYRKNTRNYITIYENNFPVSRECSKCRKHISIEMYHRHKKGKDGYNSYCMDCTAVSGKEYRDKIPEQLKLRHERYYESNKQKVKVINAVRRHKQRDQKEFYKNFQEDITKIYEQAINSTDNVAVDHIIPLKHPNVCGLHYPQNLRIISHSENCSKQNKWDGTNDNTNWKTDWRKSL